MMTLIRRLPLMALALGIALGYWAGTVTTLFVMQRGEEKQLLLWAPPIRQKFGDWVLLRLEAGGDNPSGKAFSLSLEDAGHRDARLQLFCDPIWSVTVNSNRFRDQPEGYTATYRGSGSAETTTAHWRSSGLTARPANADAFLRQLRQWRRLEVTLTAGASSEQIEFETPGFERAMQAFERRCEALPDPQPDPRQG